MDVTADEVGLVDADLRRDLLAHCYRMLGSLDDAEDVVQETMLRAWRAADRYDPERASVRTWLHRIATNACLTSLAGRRRRPLPSGLGPAGDDPDAPLTPSPEVPWLQPLPDALIADPADATTRRDGLRLALVAALQLLPPRQRAAVILRDVVRMPAAEVAVVLDTTVASVNSSLQRARSTLAAGGLDADTMRLPAEPAQRDVVERYAAAFEAADMDALARLLADDVALEMPPVDLWLLGRDNYVRFIRRIFGRRGTGWRMLPVNANGSTALAAYAPDPEDASGDLRAHSVQLFDADGGRVGRCVTFVDAGLVARFGLPSSLPRLTAPG